MELPKAHWPRMAPSKVYIRFGLWSTRSKNWYTREQEVGVSVYPAKLQENNIAELLSSDYDIPILSIQGRLAFVVTGIEVGIGSDGEPLLRRIKVLPYAIDFKSMPCGIERSAWGN